MHQLFPPWLVPRADIAAETLGITPEALKLVAGDTRQTPNAGATSASRQTYISGNAVLQAAGKLAQALKAEASGRLEVEPSLLVLDSEQVRAAANPDQTVSFAELAKQIGARGESLTFEGHFDPETIPLDPKTGQGIPTPLMPLPVSLLWLKQTPLPAR